jgi:pimeloyl-ACP methyl ester carboxylesterase
VDEKVVPAPQERLVHLPGIRLSVREWEGEGSPVLCLHGLASNARWWDLVAGYLAPRYRVVAVDLRGHGRSDRPEHGYGFPEVGGDLVSLVADLELRNPVVVGHSWGASVALWLAAELSIPAGVACIDGGAGDLRAVFGDKWEVAREAMRPPRAEGLDAKRLNQWVAASQLAEEVGQEGALAALWGNFEEGADGYLQPRLSMDRHMEIAEALYKLDQPALRRRVTCPVLFVMADDGGEMAARKRMGVEEAIQQLSGPVTQFFLRGIHDLPVQRPKAVAEALLGWIDQAEPAVGR